MARNLTLCSPSPSKCLSLMSRFSRLEVERSPLAGVVYMASHRFFIIGRPYLHSPPLSLLSSPHPAPAVPDSALPLGMERVDGSVLLVPVEPCECHSLTHTPL